MPIDSLSDRNTLLNFSWPWMPLTIPDPDESFDSVNRAHFLGIYIASADRGFFDGTVTITSRYSGTLTVNDMPSPTLFVNEDNKFKITGVYDAELAEYVNDATGTFQILDCDGVLVTSMTGDMNYVASSDGDYVGYLAKSITTSLSNNSRYEVDITLTSQGRSLYRRITVPAVYHGVN